MFVQETIVLIFLHRKRISKQNVNRPVQVHQSATHFSFIIDSESKNPPFELRASYTMSSAAPTSLSVCLSSHALGEGQRILFLLLLGLSV